jgi:hypothetical protein
MKTTWTVLLAACLGLPAAAGARDDHLKFPIEGALSTPAAKAKLDPRVKLYFGEKQLPPGATVIGETVVNRKTSAFGKSDLDACQWVFLSVLLELQDQARKAGGDAVVGIVSYYKKEVYSSEHDFMCGAGATVAGVAFRGKIAKLAAQVTGASAGTSPEPAPQTPAPAAGVETKQSP